MRLQGLHLLVTYGCNASCGHCFLSANGQVGSTMDRAALAGILDNASDIPIDHVFLEGGEPFLLRDQLLPLVEEVKGRGFWLGVLTNGYFAVDDRKALSLLEPLVEAGLDSLDVSTDLFHSDYVKTDRAIRAATSAKELGLSTGIMFCDDADRPKESRSLLKRVRRQARGISVRNGPVSCRGRAFSTGGLLPSRSWRTLTSCKEDHSDPSRVHIGPDGEVHLCQGLLIERSALEAPLSKLLSEASLSAHPIASAVKEGGPAALAEQAIQHGFEPRAGYTDGCALCFDARRHLLGVFPDLLGPSSIYNLRAQTKATQDSGNLLAD